MSNNGITRFDRNGLELIINEGTGECFASQSATARMCNTDEANIRYMCTSKKWGRISLEIPTDGGLRSSKMLNEDQIGECLAKYNPDLLAQCLKVGVRVFLYGLAGYSPKSLEKFDLKYQVGIQFNNGYYWEIPTDYHNAMKIAELAQDMAGQDIDGIVVFFGEYQEMAILTEDRGRRSIATSFGAAFAANKLCRR